MMMTVVVVEEDISRAWKRIGENMKVSVKGSPGYCELKQHKPWFDEECSELLDKKKKPKLQQL